MAFEPVVLAIDDEPAILKLVKLELEQAGFKVVIAQGGAEGVRLEDEHRPDIVVLDLVMPGMDGIETMRAIRQRANVPIIMLTGKDTDSARVEGLEEGADDYLVKPFAADELVARVRAVLRRAAGAAGMPQVIVLGEATVNLSAGTIIRDAAELELTRREWMLFQQLAANAGKVVLNEELLTSVWGQEYRDHFHYVRVLIGRLRQKLGDGSEDQRFIKTHPGIGYMLDLAGGGEPEPADAVATPT